MATSYYGVERAAYEAKRASGEAAYIERGRTFYNPALASLATAFAGYADSYEARERERAAYVNGRLDETERARLNARIAAVTFAERNAENERAGR